MSDNKNEQVITELRDIYSLLDVCCSALKQTGVPEDEPVIDVLGMAMTKLWEMIEPEQGGAE